MSLCLYLLLPSLSVTQAFHTDSCTYQDLLKVENAFIHNVKQHRSGTSICNYFRILDTAHREEYSVCFSKEQVDHFSLMERVLHRTYYEETASPEDMLRLKPELDSCDVVPTQEEVERLGRKKWVLVWLDQVETDNQCPASQKDWLQSVHGTCLDTQEANWGQRMLAEHWNMVPRDICMMMTDTIGHCLQIQMPPCFSRREAAFLFIKIREMARLSLHWWKEAVPGIEREGELCSLWEQDSLYSGGCNSRGVVAWLSVCLCTLVYSLLSKCEVR